MKDYLLKAVNTESVIKHRYFVIVEEIKVAFQIHHIPPFWP